VSFFQSCYQCQVRSQANPHFLVQLSTCSNRAIFPRLNTPLGKLPVPVLVLPSSYKDLFPPVEDNGPGTLAPHTSGGTARIRPTAWARAHAHALGIIHAPRRVGTAASVTLAPSPYLVPAVQPSSEGARDEELRAAHCG